MYLFDQKVLHVRAGLHEGPPQDNEPIKQIWIYPALFLLEKLTGFHPTLVLQHTHTVGRLDLVVADIADSHCQVGELVGGACDRGIMDGSKNFLENLSKLSAECFANCSHTHVEQHRRWINEFWSKRSWYGNLKKIIKIISDNSRKRHTLQSQSSTCSTSFQALEGNGSHLDPEQRDLWDSLVREGLWSFDPGSASWSAAR